MRKWIPIWDLKPSNKIFLNFSTCFDRKLLIGLIIYLDQTIINLSRMFRKYIHICQQGRVSWNRLKNNILVVFIDLYENMTYLYERDIAVTELHSNYILLINICKQFENKFI